MRRILWALTEKGRRRVARLPSTWSREARREHLRRVIAYDQALLLGMRRWHAPALTRLMQAFTHSGDATTWGAVTLCMWAGGGRVRKVGFRVGFAALAAALAAQALKRTWRRARPSAREEAFIALMKNPDAFSFPSGHTAAAFAVATAVSDRFPSLGLFYFPLAFGIALSRVYLGAHYPLDVLVGAGLGAAVGGLSKYSVAGEFAVS